MAYKFQMGSALMSGSLTQEEAVKVLSTISGSGNISGGSKLTIAGTSSLEGVVEFRGSGTGSPVLLDATQGFLLYVTGANRTLTRQDIPAFITALAGTGITYNAVSGKLDSDVASSPTEYKDANSTLIEGLNYSTGSCTDSRTLTLPASPAAGDVVQVKAFKNLQLNDKTLSITGSGNQEIEGVIGDAAIVVLESDNAAVSLVAATSGINARWKII